MLPAHAAHTFLMLPVCTTCAFLTSPFVPYVFLTSSCVLYLFLILSTLRSEHFRQVLEVPVCCQAQACHRLGHPGCRILSTLSHINQHVPSNTSSIHSSRHHTLSFISPPIIPSHSSHLPSYLLIRLSFYLIKTILHSFLFSLSSWLLKLGQRTRKLVLLLQS